jgi:outer membrane protein
MTIPALAAALLLQATAPETLTLEAALRRALTSNLPLRRAEEEIAAAEAQKRASLSLVLPKLNVTGALTRNNEQVAFGSGDDSRTILPLNDWATRVTLSQPIFAGLREKRTYEQAKVGIENARDAVAGARDQALLAVSTHYLATVQGEALMAVEQKNRELAAARRVHARNLYEAGETTRVDVLRAEAAVKAPSAARSRPGRIATRPADGCGWPSPSTPTWRWWSRRRRWPRPPRRPSSWPSPSSSAARCSRRGTTCASPSSRCRSRRARTCR